MGGDSLSAERTLLAASVALGCAACESERPLTVEQVTRNIHQLNGETVTVAGYLGECFGYECVLYSDKASEQKSVVALEKFIRAAKRGERLDYPGDLSPFAALGIGSGEWICEEAKTGKCHSEFDRKAAPFLNSYVLISGEVTDQCRDENGYGGCTDRSTDLKPRSIRAWRRAGNA